MGDGFATVDKRNLKTTGMSESLNPTMTTDYRLRHISTPQDVFCLFSLQWDTGLLFTMMLLNNSNSALHVTAVCLLYVSFTEETVQFGFGMDTPGHRPNKTNKI